MTRKFGRLPSASFVASHVLIPLVLLSIYLVGSSLLLPAGVNKVFTTRSASYLIPITLLLCLAFLAIVRMKKLAYRPASASGDAVSPGDLILLLLPLSPVVQYILGNADILSSLDSILVLSFFALLAALLVLAIPALLTRSGSTRPSMYMGMAFAFSITNMAALSGQLGWHEWGSLKVQLPIFAGVWLLGWLLFRLNLRNVLHLMIAGSLVANCIAQLVPEADADVTDEVASTDNQLVTLVGSRQPAITPSIYLLVYEAYVPAETMSAYGIGNRPQEQYLEGLGFKIYPHTYSLASGTLKSMSRVLNVSPNYVLDRDGRTAVAGAATVPVLLRGYGYKTYGVFPSDFYFRGATPSYDYSYPGRGSSAQLLISAILEGEFRFDLGFEDVTREQYAQEKQRALAEATVNPKFIYTQSQLPGHSQPTCLPDEIDLYAADVAKANLEMRQDLGIILASDPQAIIIVAGDHGPRLTKNCSATAGAYDISEISRLDLQDRYGAFLAIRWPSEEYEEYDDITILQDLFPAVFAYMFADARLLQSRMEPNTTDRASVSGVEVRDGVIVGGPDDGQALFISSIEE